jgi:hypothetical protein
MMTGRKVRLGDKKTGREVRAGTRDRKKSEGWRDGGRGIRFVAVPPGMKRDFYNISYFPA